MMLNMVMKNIMMKHDYCISMINDDSGVATTMMIDNHDNDD